MTIPAHFLQLQVDTPVDMVGVPPFFVAAFRFRDVFKGDVFEVSQVLFRLSRWENLEYAKKI